MFSTQAGHQNNPLKRLIKTQYLLDAPGQKLGHQGSEWPCPWALDGPIPAEAQCLCCVPDTPIAGLEVLSIWGCRVA